MFQTISETAEYMFIKVRILNAFLLAATISYATIQSLTYANAAVERPENTKSIYAKSLILLKKRQFRKSIERFTIVIDQDPSGDNVQALSLYHRGLAYQALGQLDEARSDYSRAIKLQTLKDKVLKVVYYNRGLVHDGLKRPNAALADFASAIDKNPGFSPAYHNLGNVLRKMGRHKRAIKNFLKSLELGNPQPYLTYMGLAMAYEGAGRNKEAIMSLKYALKVRPRFKKASDMLARLVSDDLYSFSSEKLVIATSEPTVTGSIPQSAHTGDASVITPGVNSDYQQQGLRLRSFVEVETQPIRYKKLALRGALENTSIGQVALIVPGPGLKEAQRGRYTKPLPRKKPRRKKLKPHGIYKAQLGISKTSSHANKTWFFLRAQHGDLLEHLKPTFQRVHLGKRGIRYRIQVGPFKSMQAADHLCKAIKERAINCFPIGNEG